MDVKKFQQEAVDFGAPLKKTYLFIPTEGKDMKAEYPELSTIAEFAMLKNTEMVFVWLIGNKTSPLHRANEKDRQLAFKNALQWSGLEERLDLNTRALYAAGTFPTSIQAAIRRMEGFVPSYRMKAKLMLEKTFENLSKMVDVSEEELKMMDIETKKKYADFAKVVTNVLDDQVAALENAYGVKEVKRHKKAAGDKSPATLMDKVMARN